MPDFTPTQGRYLSFIRAYTEGFGIPPAEAEIAQALGVTPPSAHQMIKTLEKRGLIERQAGVARSIRIVIDAESIPSWSGAAICRTVTEWVTPASLRPRVMGRAGQGGRIYQFKIVLAGSKPPIWRRIETTDVSLDAFHEHIQTAMGWTNSHLHQFEIGSKRYSDPRFMEDPFDDFGATDYTGIKISELVKQFGEKLRMTYEYDFGDGWEHSVVLEKISHADSRQTYPRCTGGARACPPEDIGGVYGYEHYLEAIGDPDHEEHVDYMEWNGECDPDAFDSEEATRAMQQGLPAW